MIDILCKYHNILYCNNNNMHMELRHLKKKVTGIMFNI